MKNLVTVHLSTGEVLKLSKTWADRWWRDTPWAFYYHDGDGRRVMIKSKYIVRTVYG